MREQKIEPGHPRIMTGVGPADGAAIDEMERQVDDLNRAMDPLQGYDLPPYCSHCAKFINFTEACVDRGTCTLGSEFIPAGYNQCGEFDPDCGSQVPFRFNPERAARGLCSAPEGVLEDRYDCYKCPYEVECFKAEDERESHPRDINTNTQDLIRQVCTEMADFLVEKNISYGDSAINPVRVFSKASAEEQINVRMDDKLSRFIRGNAFPGDDDERDLCGYLILKMVRNKINDSA